MLKLNKAKFFGPVLFAALWLAGGAAMAFPCSVGYLDGTLTPGDVPLYPYDASTNPDGDDTSDNYTTCLDGTGNDDATALNSAIFGTYNSWVEIDSFDTPGTVGTEVKIDNLVHDAEGDIVGGNWYFFDNLWDSYEALAIVLKDGAVIVGGETIKWSAYLLNADEKKTSGDWAMPDRNLSHLAVYGVLCTNGDCGGGPGGGVPLPAPIALLGLGSLLLARRATRAGI